jgi:N-methylhydantoinase A
MTPVNELPHKLSIDIGGTFTDLVLSAAASGASWVGKVLTTPADPAEAVYTGVVELLDRSGVRASQLEGVLHATTLATNVVIERKGARTALVTTTGFRDVLEIRDESRYDLFDLFLELPSPLVDREMRLEVDERVLADGSVDRPLDLARASETIASLRDTGVEAVAVSLLHSYRNPEHERLVGKLVTEILPGVELSLSHEVAPEIREFPRTATTVTNVYIKGLMRRYLARLQERLNGLGLRRDVFVMLSSGSLCDIGTAGEFPVRLVESGPAAGALGAAAYGRASGRPNLISFDMGGTTAKACLIEDGEPHRSDQFEIDRVWRFKPGSGTPIRTPVVELIEIGAGGGSIAWIDELGRLRVGPHSAGADPGPACYVRGGVEPTVTDADLVLGYLDPTSFLGGRMKLDQTRSRDAIEEKVAGPLGIDVVRAAWGIHQIVNETMAGAARMAAIERGNDPRDYPIFAFGGSGPVHAFGVARILGSPEVLIPIRAGVMSAVGLHCAPLAFDFVHSWVGLLDNVRWSEVEELCTSMERDGREILARTHVPVEDVRVTRSVDMRYLGQGYEINVPAPSGATDASAAALALTFEKTYRQRYGRVLEDVPLEIVSWRCSATGPLPALVRPAVVHTVDGRGARTTGERPVYLPDKNTFDVVPVFDRYELAPGVSLAGPAIVQEAESTLVVAGEAAITVDDHGNVLVTMKGGTDVRS